MADQNETCITFLEGDTKVGIYTSQRKYINKIMKLKEQYPDEVVINRTNPDGSICADVPADWMRLPQPKAKRNYTPEQREAQRQRLKEAREAKR